MPHGENCPSAPQKIFPDNSCDDVIFAGALFHDAGKGREPHGEVGAAIVRKELCGLVLPGEMERIAEIVLLHDRRGAEASAYPGYVKLVQDADLIDHDGTIDVWVNFWYQACEDAPMQASIEYFQKINEVDQPIRQKLLNFEVSREVQKKRYEFEKQFFERFQREAEGETD